MSLESWKEEFYPTKPHKNMLSEEAILHSLQKWIGLRKENVDKHEIRFGFGYNLVSPNWTINDEIFCIDAETCSLCKTYKKNINNLISAGLSSEDNDVCGECPLFQVLNQTCDDGSNSPFRFFKRTGNPEPMIEALQKALKTLDPLYQCDIPTIEYMNKEVDN